MPTSRKVEGGDKESVQTNKKIKIKQENKRIVINFCKRAIR
jgi:hypothetical protein